MNKKTMKKKKKTRTKKCSCNELRKQIEIECLKIIQKEVKSQLHSSEYGTAMEILKSGIV